MAHALLVVNAGSNTSRTFRSSHGTLQLVDTAPSGGLTCERQRKRPLGGSPQLGEQHSRWSVLTSHALVPSNHAAVSLSSGAATPEQVGFTPSGDHVIVTEKVSNSIDTFTVTSDGRLTGLRQTATPPNC